MQMARSHMAVQKYATLRNEQAEKMVDYILMKLSDELLSKGFISQKQYPIAQMSFEEDECKDVFDHYLELCIEKPICNYAGKLQLWAQTTCYKGNETGAPESNKTYEIRETLMEALCIRRVLTRKRVMFRTLHFTIGATGYTYGWFKDAKEKSFDLSIYLTLGDREKDIFQYLSGILFNANTEYEIFKRFDLECKDRNSKIGSIINNTIDKLCAWIMTDLMKPCVFADAQAALLNRNMSERDSSIKSALSLSKKGGANIKGKAKKYLEGGTTSDSVLIATVKEIQKKNPFLRAALDVENNWHFWASSKYAIPSFCTNIDDYIKYLWALGGSERLIIRRILLRIHSESAINYVQDVNVPGITEHNLYVGDHSAQQISAITKYIASSCKAAEISKANILYDHIVGKRGLQILRASRRLEAINGTEMKPSFIYVEKVLSKYYRFLTFANAKLPQPIGYHSCFGAANVKPYNNIKVVNNINTGNNVALIKAKYYRQQEFARRCKEESFVGLTAKYLWDGNIFKERYPGLPMIMFVDMDECLVPPEYAITRLVSAGWDVFFSIDSLRAYLDKLSMRK